LNTKLGDKWLLGALHCDIKNGIRGTELDERVSTFGSNKKKEKELSGFFKLLWEALEDNTLRILLVSSVVSIIIDMVTADPAHRATGTPI
jgi:magnesium-transporting ATPase (P-type)